MTAILVLNLAAPAAHAQSLRRDAPPYEDQLLRLAEIFGALHFLRPLCGHDDAPSWRARMQALLETEVAEENRRRRFVERFNLGYRGFSSVYRECTDAARLALTQYVEEGDTLIHDLTSRFGR
jgi:uncharacterized protein (TIGR02301 family)